MEDISRELIESVSVESKLLISMAASKYKETFKGISNESYINWMTRNFLLANSFKDLAVIPFLDECALIEIGPGLGPVLTLASLSKPVSVYSFDTFKHHHTLPLF